MLATKMVAVMTDLPVREIELGGSDVGSTYWSSLREARDGSTIQVEWFPVMERWLVFMN
jgi:hypothetical protein